MKDEELRDAIRYSVGMTNPYTNPDKFIASRKKPLDMRKFIRDVIYKYLTYTCAAQAYKKHKRDIIKQVALELELRKKALPVMNDFNKLFGEPLTTKEVCKASCRISFDCYHDFNNNDECKRNFCLEC